LLVALVLLGLIGLMVGGYGLSNHFRGFASGIPAWVKLAGIIPVMVGLHPLLAALHPVLVLLISLGGAIVGVFKRRARHGAP
jgi:hypothetical protein